VTGFLGVKATKIMEKIRLLAAKIYENMGKQDYKNSNTNYWKTYYKLSIT